MTIDYGLADIEIVFCFLVFSVDYVVDKLREVRLVFRGSVYDIGVIQSGRSCVVIGKCGREAFQVDI